RIRFSLEEKEVLERAFKKSKRPTNEVKQRLAQDMDTNVSRIQIWFQNRRAKEKK
ncbi:DUXa-paired class homeobox protein, partial [Parasitella parasitica]